jgi:hypothetical protein
MAVGPAYASRKARRGRPTIRPRVSRINPSDLVPSPEFGFNPGEAQSKRKMPFGIPSHLWYGSKLSGVRPVLTEKNSDLVQGDLLHQPPAARAGCFFGEVCLEKVEPESLV